MGGERAGEMSEETPDQCNENTTEHLGSNTGESMAKTNRAEVPSPKPMRKPRKPRRVRNPIESEEYFGVQYSKTSDLPDPVESLKALATGVVEVIAGTRHVDQLARWLTDDVYQRLQFRARRAEAQRAEQGVKAHYQNLSVGGLRTCSPRDGVIESVILLSSKSRTRAVTIRLEGINARWRATSVSVL
jgi:Family of unknown function (DUF6459)